ncbi:MAG: hypothetical protein IJ795_08610 [Bacteroidales bacterium]|nr:hypothetical protein [Bacteroidales bacterium]
MTVIKRLIHIILPVLLLTGCFAEPEALRPGPDMVLTVRCEEALAAKSTEADGETRFNENLLKSVDFFFYQGDSPSADADAVYHIRKDMDEDPVSFNGSRWEATFELTIKKVDAERIFTTSSGLRATVYAIVNYDGALTDGESLSGTSASALEAKRVVTDFPSIEKEYVQPRFLMDGKAVVSYDGNASPSVSGVIEVRRFASKITTAITVDDEVVLKHSTDEPDEVWTPVLHTMRIYLVDGVKTVSLGVQGSEDNTGPEYFSYNAAEAKRPFVKDNGETYLNPDTVNPGGPDERVFYNTFPMYSYPCRWDSSSQPDYTAALPAQPYLKLEMDWRREQRNGYTYDRRKYYYKIFFPFESFERNNWYHFNIGVGILGSETDEGKAILDPTCYILEWQNKSVPIDKYAVISKARYLSVETLRKSLHNIESFSLPFLSSHDVKVVESSVRATRPYYGEIKNESDVVDKYNTKYHAWVRKNAEGGYYLDYKNQPAGSLAYEPSSWLSNTSTSIELNHTLQNEYWSDDFDYSPYTIEFDIVHDDLIPGVYPYNEYLRHITITQYPGIYIESLMNSDTDIIAKGYPDGSWPWLDRPWGYVYIDNGRFLRTGQNEDYSKLTTDNNRKEYQWRTVWYTGGGRDIFKINVTVLPEGSEFVIGDPRIDGYDTTEPVLGYSFVNDGTSAGDAILPDHTGAHSNFTPAPVVDGDVAREMAKTGEVRPLTYYRPTEKSGRTAVMLAPNYRISTKLGGTEYGKFTEDFAKYRCAGYQEDGFPGGRWRLPTKGEVKFIAQLSSMGVFEFLFNKGDDYWSANGAVRIGDGTVTDSNSNAALLRCVYDSWYWGDEQWNPRSEFVWGDREE